MKIQASGCYYHSGKLAVATCSKCGVGICRDCAIKNNQGIMLCYPCGNEQLKEEHKQYRKQLSEHGGRFNKISELVIPTIIGILIIVAKIVAEHYGIITQSDNGLTYIAVSYLLFTIPFGFVVLNDLIAPKYDSLAKIVNRYCMMLFGAFFIGWIVFPYAVIKFFINNIMLKQ